MEDLTIDSFRPLQGTVLALRAGDATLDVELVEVRSLGRAYTGRREAFALLFRGPPDPLRPQATYPIAAEPLGEHDIFIVPVGRTAEGTEYEAIFT